MINNEEKEYKEIINNNLDDEVCSDEDFINENNYMIFDEIFPQERKKKGKRSYNEAFGEDNDLKKFWNSLILKN